MNFRYIHNKAEDRKAQINRDELITEASANRQRELMKEIQRRREAGEPAMISDERTEFLKKSPDIDPYNREYGIEGYFWPETAAISTVGERMSIKKYRAAIDHVYNMDPLKADRYRSIDGWCNKNMLHPILDKMGNVFNDTIIRSYKGWSGLGVTYDNAGVVDVKIAPLVPNMDLPHPTIWGAPGYVSMFPKLGVFVEVREKIKNTTFVFSGMMYRRNPIFSIDINVYRARYSNHIKSSTFPENAHKKITSAGNVLSNFN